MSQFADYCAHGWQLCPITPGLKGPTTKGWNAPGGMVTHPLSAARLEAAGLCHAYSGTCAIDIDDMRLARLWLKERGVDLDALLAAPDAVRIKSPTAGRGKLIYACPVPLPSKTIGEGVDTILEFRCASANGLTVQDVLPPSAHPNKAGEIDGVYEWIGDWRVLPDLPNEVFTLWTSLLSTPDNAALVESTVTRDQLIASLQRLSPNLVYDEWARIGMAIHHEFNGSDEGLKLWDTWSKNSTKYKGIDDLASHWKSFTAGGGVTGQSLEVMTPFVPTDFPDDAALAAMNASSGHKPKTHSLWTAAELLKTHDAPPQLVKGMLERGAEASIIGPSKSYKTLWALQLSVSVATGTPFFGREVEQGLVVYLCGEGFGGMRHRLQALKAGIGFDFSDAPFVVYPRALALPSPEGIHEIKDYIAAAEQVYGRSLSLLVIDTYGRYAAGEENVAEDLYAFFRAAGACRGRGALLVVHHTGHSDATRGRGTSAWEQAVDTEFVASIKSDTDLRVIENTKQKDGEPCPPAFFRLKRHKTNSTRVGEPVYSVVLEPAISSAELPKLGAIEQLVYDALNSVGSGLVEEVLDKAAAAMPAPDGKGRDKRKDHARRALLTLVSKHVAVVKGDHVFKYGDVIAEFIGEEDGN